MSPNQSAGMQAGCRNVRRSADDARAGVLLGVDEVARVRVVRRRVARQVHWDGRAPALVFILGRADGDHMRPAEALAQLADDVDGVDRAHDCHLVVLHVHEDFVDTWGRTPRLSSSAEVWWTSE